VRVRGVIEEIGVERYKQLNGGKNVCVREFGRMREVDIEGG
jgi:hypothetical protein